MFNKRKHEIERDDFIFKSEKKQHKNLFDNNPIMERNIYEFDQQFEELKKYITLFNRSSKFKKIKNNNMQIEENPNTQIEIEIPITKELETKKLNISEDLNKIEIKKEQSEKQDFNHNNKIFDICGEFGKINNITN